MASRDPVARFRDLFEEASRDAPFDPTAVTLATANAAGRPSARIVLLKGFDGDGFRFFTNYESRKGRELEANPQAALCVYWPWTDRQVRIEGAIERLAAEASDAYFATRHRGSQLGAWAAHQSRELDSRFALLRRVVRTEASFLGRPVRRPPHWGGFLLRPERIEFWSARTSRLHERDEYRREGDAWTHRRLQP